MRKWEGKTKKIKKNKGGVLVKKLSSKMVSNAFNPEF